MVERRDDGTCLIYIDRHLVHEVTSPQAFEALRLAGRPVRRPDLTLAVPDHNLPTTPRVDASGNRVPIADPQSAAQLAALEANAPAFGIPYIDANAAEQGIVHVVGPEQGFSLPGTTISAHELLIIFIAPIILLLLWFFTSRTATGRSLRAVGQNQDAAAMIGINVSTTFALTFALGAALAALSGILLGGIRFVTPSLGVEPLVKAMIVVIFGGLGSLGATVGAAFVIGMAEALLVLTIELYWTPFVLFAGLILVLVFRPNGLFGKA